MKSQQSFLSSAVNIFFPCLEGEQFSQESKEASLFLICLKLILDAPRYEKIDNFACREMSGCKVNAGELLAGFQVYVFLLDTKAM